MQALAYYEDLGDRLLVVNANTTKRNALSPDYYSALQSALELAAAESRITSVILHGEAGFFCAGGDLSLIATRRELPRPQRLQKIEDLHDVIRAIVACPKPVIAAVSGGAAGAGVSLAFACDFLVADEQAKFTVAYVKAGLVPDGGLTSTLSTQLPRALVMRMALLGEAIPARQLNESGAILQLSSEGKALEAAHELADKLSNGASATQGVIKGLVNRAQSSTLEEQMDAERDAMVDAVVTAEASEGINAFLEKRAPDFKRLRAVPA
ncbi:oxepin-CoA hydrolase, alternative type [Granulosicoccus antarcticus]|uniref:2,3-dehydroadipyl-CoA hydratase n=1 Tax=Granulosicoccus antarcticus IMCC3135 TaxID=1192854 RepID=A0A2Z2NSY9_9GAMM|nr:enoyl-CoA hydratase family protein [Granulosicoccus antarcticus]ASJ73141.1 2,3-dehydroadipyl-CoA hydratase [Granulosicoccus antarcticus IMCC3135]